MRTIASTLNLALMASNLEQILRATVDPVFFTTFQKPQRAGQDPAVTLEAALESENSPQFRLFPAPDVPPPLPELLNYLFLRSRMRMRKKKWCTYMRAKRSGRLSKPRKTRFYTHFGFIMKRPAMAWGIFHLLSWKQYYLKWYYVAL